MSKEAIWNLTLPQLGLLLAQIDKHIKYDIALVGGEVGEEREITGADLALLQSMPHIG